MNGNQRLIVTALLFALTMVLITSVYMAHLETPPVEYRFPSENHRLPSSAVEASRIEAAPPPSLVPSRAIDKPPMPASLPESLQEAEHPAPELPLPDAPPELSYHRKSSISWPDFPPASSHTPQESGSSAPSPPSGSGDSTSSAGAESGTSPGAGSSEGGSSPSHSEPSVPEEPSSGTASQPPPEGSSPETPSSSPSSLWESSPETPSSSPPSSLESSSAPPSSGQTASSETETQWRENERHCQELSERYEIRILILRRAEEDPDGLAREYAADAHRTGRALLGVERALSPFPESFFKGGATILIADRFAETRGRSPAGAVFFFSCLNPAPQELSESLAAHAADCFLEEGSFTMEGHMPEDFLYGAGQPREEYVFSSRDPYNGWFLSLSAQKSPEQDMREILTSFFLEPGPLERVPPETAFYEKLRYCSERFAAWRPSMESCPAVQYFLQ